MNDVLAVVVDAVRLQVLQDFLVALLYEVVVFTLEGEAKWPNKYSLSSLMNLFLGGLGDCAKRCTCGIALSSSKLICIFLSFSTIGSTNSRNVYLEC